MKTVQILCALVIFSQINTFKMPDQVCKPMKQLGSQVARDVMNCAKNSKAGKKAMALAKKAGKKIPSSAALANKMVSAIASKVGCRRRLWSVGGLLHKAGHFIHKVGSKVVNKVKSAGHDALNAGIKFACQKLAPMCPKACDAGISKIVPLMKKYKIPSKCFNKVAKNTCHNACKMVCKRRLRIEA